MAFEDVQNFGAPVVPAPLTKYQVEALTITADRVGVVRLSAKSADNSVTVGITCTVLNGTCSRFFDSPTLQPLTVERPSGFNQLVAAILSATTVDNLRSNVTGHLVTIGLLT